MIKFLIQTIDGKIKHDFCFELDRAIEYQNWKQNEMFASYCDLEDLEKLNFGVDADEINEYTPVGSIEFVYKFIDLFIKDKGSHQIQPLNVPQELFEYAGTNMTNCHITDDNRENIECHLDNELVFVKSNETIKSAVNGFYRSPFTDLIPNGYYQIRNKMDIVSEYRCFVYNDNLVGIQYYSGEFSIFPDALVIDNILQKYKYDYGNGNAPQAFTIDVGVTSDETTVVIECHEFFSCGTYGFSDYNVLPFMFKRTFDSIKKRLIE